MNKAFHFSMDIPDPDVIFHDGFYYLITTTMHFFPGGEILRSKDLNTIPMSSTSSRARPLKDLKATAIFTARECGHPY